MPKGALAKVETGLVPAKAHKLKTSAKTIAYPIVDNTSDYFVEKDGVKFAGMHLLLELWDAENLNDPKTIDAALRRAAEAAGATILHVHLHHFSPNGGVSGVLVLAESHISIHTWPERAYAAVDIFMCGKCDPYKSIPVLKQAFRAKHVQLTEHKRGLIP
jgi:S-adenosylmethionine decarboxylase